MISKLSLIAATLAAIAIAAPVNPHSHYPHGYTRTQPAQPQAHRLPPLQQTHANVANLTPQQQEIHIQAHRDAFLARSREYEAHVHAHNSWEYAAMVTGNPNHQQKIADHKNSFLVANDHSQRHQQAAINKKPIQGSNIDGLRAEAQRAWKSKADADASRRAAERAVYDKRLGHSK